MINRHRSAFGALAGLVLVVAAACGGSSATPVPTAPKDAAGVITNALSGTPDVKSFHIKVSLSGTIKASGLSGATGSALAGDLKLDGTSIEGDADVANSAAHIAVNVAPISALGGVPITADVIVVDKAIYFKTALLGGDKYTKMDLSSVAGLAGSLPLPSIPVSLPSAGGSSAISAVTDQIAALRKQLDAAGAKAEVVGTEKIGGQDATHVKVTVPIDWINQQIAAQASAAGAQMKLDSASFDMWVYTSNNMLAQIHLAGASSAIGNIDLMMTITNVDQPVTIKAPAASDVSTANPFAP